MARKTPPSRVSRGRVLEQLKVSARRGDRAALALAIDQMRTLAFSPRYWEKYLQLLRHPLARLVDLLVIKQGEKIARQKGWEHPKRRRAPGPPGKARRGARAKRTTRTGTTPTGDLQPSLFPDLY